MIIKKQPDNNMDHCSHLIFAPSEKSGLLKFTNKIVKNATSNSASERSVTKFISKRYCKQCCVTVTFTSKPGSV